MAFEKALPSIVAGNLITTFGAFGEELLNSNIQIYAKIGGSKHRDPAIDLQDRDITIVSVDVTCWIWEHREAIQ